MVTIALTSCRTIKYIDRTTVDSTEIAVPITNTKIEYRDRFLHDSIYVHDSIFTLIKGDTVYIYKNKETNRLVNKTDTIIKTDTKWYATFRTPKNVSDENPLCIGFYANASNSLSVASNKLFSIVS